MERGRILIVEDDPAIAALLEMNLSLAGYRCRTAPDGDAALAAAAEEPFDLALLDILLPGVDGFALCAPLREREIPVIYLSAKSDTASKVAGLRLGAEDYMTKPFDVLELLVRVEKVLERRRPRPACYRVGGVTLHEAEHTVRQDGRPVELTPMEYALLLLLMKHPDMVFSREQLLQEVWGERYFGETRTVDNHIAALRKKLGWGARIVTVHRVGYKLLGGD